MKITKSAHDIIKLGHRWRIRQANTLKLDKVVMPNRDRILQTAAHYGAHSIRLFGSVARCQDDSDSDIDFLVEMEPGRSLFDLGGLTLSLSVV